jgi:hypothetical protein
MTDALDPNVRYRLICSNGSNHFAGDQGCGPHRLEPMAPGERTPTIIADIAGRVTRNAALAAFVDDLFAENGRMKAELARRATATTEDRENLLRALAQAVRSENLTRARTLAHQETLTR